MLRDAVVRVELSDRRPCQHPPSLARRLDGSLSLCVSVCLSPSLSFSLSASLPPSLLRPGRVGGGRGVQRRTHCGCELPRRAGSLPGPLSHEQRRSSLSCGLAALYLSNPCRVWPNLIFHLHRQPEKTEASHEPVRARSRTVRRWRAAAPSIDHTHTHTERERERERERQTHAQRHTDAQTR